MTRLWGIGAAWLLGMSLLAGGCKDDGLLDRDEGPVEEAREGVDKEADKVGEGMRKAGEDAEKGVGGSGEKAEEAEKEPKK